MTTYKELLRIYANADEAVKDAVTAIPNTYDVEAMVDSYMAMYRNELSDMDDCIETLDTIRINTKNLLKYVTDQYNYLKNRRSEYKSMREIQS